MSKLLKFKEWLTMPDAARHLSIMFGEEVHEHDVLRLGLDGHLQLSVNLVNHAKARRGRVSRYTKDALAAAIASGNLPVDLKWITFPAELMAGMPNIPEAARGQPSTMLASLNLDGERYLTFDDDEVISIKGIWDLPMIGGESLDIEHEYQQLTDGPAITLETLDGAFVQRVDDEIWQLQESLDDNEFQRGSNASLERLKGRIINEGLGRDEADRLLAAHREDREKFLAERKVKPKSQGYYPAGGLPRDAVIVVRTSALYDLQQRSNDRQEEKPIGTKERNTLLTMIAALAAEAKIDLERPSKAATLIEGLTDQLGAPVSKRAIEDHLKSIPTAIAGRLR